MKFVSCKSALNPPVLCRYYGEKNAIEMLLFLLCTFTFCNYFCRFLVLYQWQLCSKLSMKCFLFIGFSTIGAAEMIFCRFT